MPVDTAVTEAARAQDAGVVVFTVGLGQDVDVPALAALTSRSGTSPVVCASTALPHGGGRSPRRLPARANRVTVWPARRLGRRGRRGAAGAGRPGAPRRP